MIWNLKINHMAGAVTLIVALVLTASCTTSEYASKFQAQSHTATLVEKFSMANSENVVVVAHRGCWNIAPENSIQAIEACIQLGVDVVELDVRTTSDGVLVLMHDDSIDRTTTGTGLVAELTYADLAQTRLKNRNGDDANSVSQEAPPTFEAAMLAAKGRILVNLDAKADVYDAAFAVLRKTNTEDHIIMKKRILPGDSLLSDLGPFNQVISMPVIFQSDDPELLALRAQIEGSSSAVELIFDSLSYAETAAKLAGENGKPAWVNTLWAWTSAGLYDDQALKDPDAVWGLFIDLGYDIIQTDEPEALMRYLASR